MEEVESWFAKAITDFETAKYNIKGGKYDAGIFFLQQSAEKALKALYIKKYKKLVKTHDLLLLSKKTDAPKEIMTYCKELNPAYQFTRYPDVIDMENLDELSDKFISNVKEILKWSKKKISSKG